MIRDALRIDVELEDAQVVESVRGLAEAAIRRGAFERAGRLWRIAERLAEEIELRAWPEVSKRVEPRAETLSPAERRSFEDGRDAAADLPLDAALTSIVEGSLDDGPSLGSV